MKERVRVPFGEMVRVVVGPGYWMGVVPGGPVRVAVITSEGFAGMGSLVIPWKTKLREVRWPAGKVPGGSARRVTGVAGVTRRGVGGEKVRAVVLLVSDTWRVRV